MRILRSVFILLAITVCSNYIFGQDIAADTTLANKYFEKATIFKDSTQYDSAIYFFKKAGEFYFENKLWDKYIHTETQHSECYQEQWLITEAVKIIKTALEKTLAYTGENEIFIADTYHFLGLLYYYNSENNKTSYYWEKTLDIRRKLLGENHIDVASSYANLGLIFSIIDHYDLSLEYNFKAVELFKKLLGEDHFNIAMSYMNIGNVYAYKCENDLALKYYNNALKIFKENIGDEHPQIAGIYNNIGIVYSNKGEMDLAMEYYYKALNIRKKNFSELSKEVAASYLNIGVLHYDKYEDELALEYDQKALKIYIKLFGEIHTDVAECYTNIGNLYDREKSYDLAIDKYSKALKIFQELDGENHTSVAMSYNNLGITYLHKKEYEIANKYFIKSLKIYKNLLSEKHSRIANAYNNIARVYQAQNENTKALNYYSKAIESCLNGLEGLENIYSVPIINDYCDWNQLLTSLLAKAEIHSNQNSIRDLFLSLKNYQACDTLINKVREEINSKSDKIMLGEDAIRVYQGAVNVCNRLTNEDKKESLKYRDLAFYFSEKSKSSVLLEALAGAEAREFAGIPGSLLENEHHMSVDIAFYKEKLAEMPDSSDEIRYRDKLFRLNRKYDALIQTFEENYPKYFELKYNKKPAGVSDIQNLLDDKTAMISYFTGDRTTTIFTITKNDLNVKTVPTIKNLADTIKYYRYGLIYTSSSRFAEMYKKQAYQFYKKLIPENIADSIENVIIIPDAELSMIPFETFLTEEAEDKEWKDLPYLIKKYSISYSYSANLFYKTFPKEPTQQIETTNLNEWLAFAPVFDDSNTAGLTLRTRELLRQFDPVEDSIGTRGRLVDGGYISPLPGTESEVKSIFTEFDEKGKKAQVQMKKNANEDFIKSGGLRNYKYLHFATHGFVNTEKPELSGIFLAQDSTLEEDGILYQGEIYNLDLNADLTVLSACETGLGQIKKGEGLIGLTRALLYAGSKNIIVSLWSVADESTSDLMIDFYKNLLEENEEKPEFSKALQQAKLKMINEGKFAHPFYWSPFILIGK